MTRATRNRNERRDRTDHWPSPATIRRRAAAIRAEWTDQERDRRRRMSERYVHLWEISLTPGE